MISCGTLSIFDLAIIIGLNLRLTLSERELHDDVSDALDELHKANR
jgi:hypothetical protein